MPVQKKTGNILKALVYKEEEEEEEQEQEQEQEIILKSEFLNKREQNSIKTKRLPTILS